MMHPFPKIGRSGRRTSAALPPLFPRADFVVLSIRKARSLVPLGLLLLARTENDFTPVTPSPEDAREQALRELSQFKYQRDPSIWQRILEWAKSLLEKLLTGKTGELSLSEIVTLIFIAIAVIAFIYFSFHFGIQLRRKKVKATDARRRKSLFLDDSRSAAELFTAANEAEIQGDLNTAIIERFRGVIKHLAELGMIELRPGLTAMEAVKLAVQKTGHADLFDPVARYFDDIFYGSAQASQEQVALSAALAQFVQNVQPQTTQKQSRKSAHKTDFTQSTGGAGK